MPERFDLRYTGEDNEDHQPVMIHRALYGSYERFFMVLIEHFNGKFPTWLSPEQVRILPISDDNIEYAERLESELSEFRVTVEDRSWTLSRKIREGQTDRVPYMLIVGDNEEESGTVSVRDRKERERQDVDPDAFREYLEREVDQKHLEPTFLS
jgi:threonyl-tRNA synthetase